MCGNMYYIIKVLHMMKKTEKGVRGNLNNSPRAKDPRGTGKKKAFIL